MKKYVVTKTSNANFLLSEYRIEDVFNTLEEAENGARDLVKSSKTNHFVFGVDLELVSSVEAVTISQVRRHGSAK